MPSYSPVAAVVRGLEVLRIVNRAKLATIKLIHAETGYDKGTIVRMLETLIAADYVKRDETTGGYRVTGRVMQLSAGFDRYDLAASLAGPVLARFRGAVGWPSDFALRDGDAMIVVRTTREPGPLAFDRSPGFRAPILLTSIGRAYLAHCTQKERDEILNQIRSGPNGRDIPESLDAVLTQTRSDGFSVMDDGYSQREYNGILWAIAVPVMATGQVYGAINVMMLRQAVGLDKAREVVLPALREASAEIAKAFVTSEFNAMPGADHGVTDR